MDSVETHFAKRIPDVLGYWRRRLNLRSDLVGTGTAPFGLHYQRYLYALKTAAIRRVLGRYKSRLRGGRVLNIGCGTGYFEPVFAACGAAEVVGVDFVDSAIRILRERQGGFEYHTVDIGEPLPDWLANRSFDLVTAIDVLYHILDDERFAMAVDNACRLCRADGGVLLWTDAPYDVDREQAPHVRHRPWSRYVDQLARRNTTMVDSTPMYHLFDTTTRWSQRLGRHPRLTYPLMYAFDRMFAARGWRKSTNYCALAVRGATR